MRLLIGPTDGESRDYLRWQTPVGRIRRFTPHPASYNKQPLTMLFDVFQQYPTAMPVLATVGGLIIGSFLNVVIWRYPIMLRQQMAEFHGEMSSAQSKISLALPRSHCPHCQQTIRVRDNIPLLSWLMLKGRCRDCQAKISKRYPLVELLTALAFLLASLVWPESGWGLAVT